MHGVRHGDLLTYYPDGRLKRRDHYNNGFCGIGHCYGPDGIPEPYFIYEQLPLYPGGEVVLMKELTKAMHLTAPEITAMRNDNYLITRQIQSQILEYRHEVQVELAVSVEGRVTNARVVQSTAQYLNNAALRAVAKLKRQFVPSRRDGEAINSWLTVSVYYTIERPQPLYQQPRYPGRRLR